MHACRMAPHKDCVVQATHALVLCRPTYVSSRAYAPLAAPECGEQQLADALTTWVPAHLQPVPGNNTVVPMAAAAAAAAGPQMPLARCS
jgi:hypothetical protein